METVSNLSEAQRLALEKLKALVGDEQVDYILAQGPDVLHARLAAFMHFESTLIGQVHDHWRRLCRRGMSQYRTWSQRLVPLS